MMAFAMKSSDFGSMYEPIPGIMKGTPAPPPAARGPSWPATAPAAGPDGGAHEKPDRRCTPDINVPAPDSGLAANGKAIGPDRRDGPPRRQGAMVATLAGPVQDDARGDDWGVPRTWSR